MGSQMQTFLRRALFAFLAAWMPFCCCQVRAAVQIVAHAQHATADCADEAQADDCCCEVDAAAEADSGCCGGEQPVRDGDCCATCKDRVGPVAPAVELPDLSPQIDAVATALLADAARTVASTPIAAARAPLDTGPPWRPHGRATLALHATLLI